MWISFQGNISSKLLNEKDKWAGKIFWGCGEGRVIEQIQEHATGLWLWDCGQLRDTEKPDVEQKDTTKGIYITIQIRPELITDLIRLWIDTKQRKLAHVWLVSHRLCYPSQVQVLQMLLLVKSSQKCKIPCSMSGNQSPHQEDDSKSMFS